MTINEIMTDTRQVTELPSVKPSQYDATTEQLVRLWEIELADHDDRQRTPNELMFAYHLFSAWKSEHKMERPAIVACAPGYGKSTALKVFLHEKVRQESYFGAIIVKEKLNDLEELANYINGEGGRYAYYIKGSDKFDTREDYEKQFANQEHYNVVLMSMEQFRLQTVKGSLNNFGSFKPRGSRYKTRRDLLVIDERPKLVISKLVTAEDITKFMADVRRVGADQYPETYELLRTLRNKLEDVDVMHGDKLTPQSIDPERFKFPGELKSILYASYSPDQIAKFRALESLVSEGGTIENIKGNIRYSITIKMAYDWNVYNTFIMDGTGRFDPNYITKDSDFTVLAPPPEHDGSNMIFHFCDEYLFSKSQLGNGKIDLNNVANECERIQQKHGGQLLVVSNKEYVEALTTYFEGKDSIKLKHYDGGRGSNDYKDIDTAIYIGNMFKGEYVYRGAAEVLLEGFVERVIEAGTTVGSYGVRLNDPLAQEYRDYDQAVDFTQEINRMRANNKDNEVNIYVLNKDEPMMQLIYREYPKAQQRTYTPMVKLDLTKDTNEDRIVGFLKTMVHGQEITKKLVREKLGINANTFKDVMKGNRVKCVCLELGIEISKFKFKKNGEVK
jgi:hypothetical protein